MVLAVFRFTFGRPKVNPGVWGGVTPTGPEPRGEGAGSPRDARGVGAGSPHKVTKRNDWPVRAKDPPLEDAMSEKKRVLCVVGPTACGKTKMGVLLAKQYGGEVVSVDTMQICRGMTVDSAAPTAE